MPPTAKGGSDQLFSEWTRRVYDELAQLNSRFETLDHKYNQLHGKFEERIALVDKTIERINDLMTGGIEPSKGIVVRIDRIEQRNVEDLLLRVDRLEQSESRRTWLLRATVVACLGAIGATIASYFRK
jgi:hypothetical protein